MFTHLNVVAASVFIFFFALVTVLGFVAAHWKAGDLGHIHEWGLGGGRFGPWITWFLLGGDLYTAYTVIAIPALVFAVGAFGFFAVPYTIIIYPFLYLTMPRLWAVSHRHGYITAGDFVLGRYGESLARAGGRADRHPRHHALYRAAAGRNGEGHRRAGLFGRGAHATRADHHRVRDSRLVHVPERPARAGDDRLRQGCDDLYFHHRGGGRHSLSSSAVSQRYSRRRKPPSPRRWPPRRFRPPASR